MRAGYGKYELTPPMGVELAGFGYYLERRAQTVIDPLFARAVLLEAGLSFLGLGLQPPAPAWGSMLSYAQGYIDQGIHYLLAPTLAIFLLVLSINTCGDALRDWLDPKSRRR